MDCSTTQLHVLPAVELWIIIYMTILPLPNDTDEPKVLNIVSVKLVDLELGITYTGIVYILGVTILSHVRSKDLTSPDTTQSLIMTSLYTEQLSSKYTDT